MSMDTENEIDASEASNAKRASGIITGVSSKLIEEKFRANLKPLNVKISKLTQLLNQLIQDNSAKITPTVAPRTHCTQTEPPLSREAGPSRNLSGTAIGGTRLWPDKRVYTKYITE